MAHAIPDFVKLTGKFNKPVKTGKPRKITADGRDRTAYQTRDASETLDKPIQIYRQWYRFLQLALELEEKNVTNITEEVRVKYPKPKRDAYGHMRSSYLKPTKHKVKVNRSKYKDWDIKTIPTTSFDAWWKTHRELFFSASAELVNSKSKWIDDSNFQYIRFDKRKRANDIVNEIRQLLNKTERSVISTAPYSIHGMSNMRTLQNRYNALILKLSTEKTDADILNSSYFRSTQMGMDGDEDFGTKYKITTTHGRVMRSLIQTCQNYNVINK